jgi:Uma2 family endonuclease
MADDRLISVYAEVAKSEELRTMPTKTSRPSVHSDNILHGVDWESYIRMRNHPRNGHLRMSYLDGTLILVSPQFIHDRYGWRIAKAVDLVCEALAIPAQGTLSTTLQRKGPGQRKGAAKEPDMGFYFRENEPRMRNKDSIILEVDPPPDLAIEIDNKSDSSKALTLYARIGVPEVWRYKARTKRLWFGRLVGENYETIERSLNLPMLTPALVLAALDKMNEIGETAANPWVREWARSLPNPAV